MRAAEQAIASRHAQNLNRIHSMDALPTLASLPELQDRRHSMPAGADGALRRSRPPPLRGPAQQESRADDTAAAGAVLCICQALMLCSLLWRLAAESMRSDWASSALRPYIRPISQFPAMNEDVGPY